jgi:DNA mismatch repair ATPase MutS
MERETLLKRQINRLSETEKKYKKISQNYSWVRLASVLAAIVIGLFAIFQKSNLVAASAIAVVIFVFGGLTFFHARVKKTLINFAKLISIYKQHQARLKLNWDELPENKTTFPDSHPFGFDLDIYGPFSLQRLLDQCTIVQGSKILEGWLLQPELDPIKIIDRQKKVKELSSLFLFRNKLLRLDSAGPVEKTDTRQILSWLKNIKLQTKGWLPIVLSALAITNIVLFFLHQNALIGPLWYFSFTAYVIIHLAAQMNINRFFSEAIELTEDLRRIFKIFYFIEYFSFSQPRQLQEILKPIQQKESKPSTLFKMLNRNIAMIGLRMNPVMAIILNIFLPWDYLVAFRLKKVTNSLQNSAPAWFEAWHEIDALSALAQFCWLNPSYVFPEIRESNTNLYFEAKQLGHPLIAQHIRKRNDFNINPENQVNIITGSNMSGKSTFLRTIGINLTLSYAGAPVCAEHLNTRLFKLHSCIRINDSLSEGLSYFYAEVRRLKEILEDVKNNQATPVLFLIDEIFKGTNNKERLIGSLAYIKELALKKGIGLVSTHDLELVMLQEEVENLKNFHFREDIKEGKMVFDYQLRPGPSPTTNALKIMELEGLPVQVKSEK